MEWARGRLKKLTSHGTTTITLDVSPIAEAIDSSVPGEEGLNAALAGGAGQAITDTAEQIARLLLEKSSRLVAEQRKSSRGFEARLRRAWEPALCIFDLVHAVSHEVGVQLNEEFRPQAAARSDFVFEALTRLHGRACLTASEIGALLRSGHATGANTRWRTLNELAVVSLFVSEKGQDAAKRFLDHQVVEMYRGAKLYSEFAARLNFEPLNEAELENLRQAVQEREAEYGRGFTRQYGWAREFVDGNPSFRAIAAAIDMDHWAPYVHLASHGVHSGPRGSYFDLGLPESMEAIPSGPSHFGLADPGQNSLMSLGQATAPLFSHCVGLCMEDIEEAGDPVERLVRGVFMCARMEALNRLINHGVNLFVEIADAMDEESAWSSSPPEILKPLHLPK